MNYIVLDTETTNGFDDPLAYDFGWAVIDENGNMLKSRSYVNAEIFLDEPELMASAYFADKIPMYLEDIEKGIRTLAKISTIALALRKDCKQYEVKAIIAHNARFDYRSCQTTQRWLSNSRYRFFFPYGVEIYDSLKMARQTYGKDKAYKEFCKEHNFMVNGKPRLTAEILYRYISNNLEFEEKHTGLEDVMIEKEIFVNCLKMNPNLDCRLWEN